MKTLTAQPNMTLLDDMAAIRRYAKRGDTEAFLLLVRRYEGMVLATCRRALSNPADAEDATQETFLKLAQQARFVRSSVPSWLHRCAVGASIDLVRRSAAQQRADARAAAHAESADELEQRELAWEDLEPLIDRALDELRDRDRDLIVARYLAGRSQVELAREAGVSESTMSRRLSSAVRKLRTALGVTGLSVIGVGALTTALRGAASTTVPTPVTAAIGKIAISGVGSSGAGVSVAGLSAIAAGVVLIGGLIATPILTGAGAGVTAGATAARVNQPQRELGPRPPRGTIGPFQVVSASDEAFEDRGIWITKNAMSIRHGYTDQGQSRWAALDIVRVNELQDDPDTRNLSERAVITARVARLVPVGDEFSRFKLGQRLSIRCATDNFGRLVLEEANGEAQLGRNEPRWYGVRPPVGWPEYGRIPEDAGPVGLLGPWTESERIPVTITASEIKFGTDSWSSARYRIVEWERTNGWSRILSVHAGGRDPRLIGTRFRLLLRKDDEGYTIAYYQPGTSRADQWPSSFEFSGGNPVRVVTFSEGP
ncbi:MAG: sigma-70 family RNA polymerase sigma factor [Planctomycetota bacterium]